jgi:hypothetical protein
VLMADGSSPIAWLVDLLAEGTPAAVVASVLAIALVYADAAKVWQPYRQRLPFGTGAQIDEIDGSGASPSMKIDG